jgi:hypothetical protein
VRLTDTECGAGRWQAAEEPWSRNGFAGNAFDPHGSILAKVGPGGRIELLADGHVGGVMKSSPTKHALIAFVCLALMVSFRFDTSAQEVTGTIVGTVVDATGAAVPRAELVVTATDRNQVVRTVKTGSDGNFVATLLPIGKYSIKVNVKGFKQLLKPGIELHINETLTYRLEMQVGDVAEQVTVEARPVQVELQSPTAAGLISGSEIRELSLNNRNYLQLISLMPGVTSNSATDEIYIGTTNPLGSTNTIPFSINGGRNSGNNYMVDGADNVDRGSNSTLLNTPSVDAIAEFTVLRGQYSAEYGRGATGQINVITKSGSSRWHGDAHEFFRNDKLAANNFFNNFRNIPRPPLRYNNFGWTFGGPLYIPGHYNRGKNKTFFFFSQEFRRVITYSTFNALVPTDDMKAGNFTLPVCVQSTGSTCTQTATKITNISPLAAAYIKDVWSKVPSGDPGTFNLFTPQRSNYNHRQELVKVDHAFSSKWTAFVRYIQDAIPTVEPGGLFTGAVIPGVSTTSTNSPGHGWVVRLTGAITRTLLNEAGYAYSYGAIVSRPAGLIGANNSPDIHARLPFPTTLGRIPSLTISGANSLTGFGPYDDFNRNWNYFDNMTKLLGRHTLKFGVIVNYYQKTENAAGNNAGSFSTTNTPRPTGTPSILQGWANFLLGRVSSFTQTSLDLTPDMRQRQWEAYLQDDYRVFSNFTLNLGVRYSNYHQPFDANHLLTSFDPALWDPSKAPKIDPATGNIVPGTGDPLNGIIINGSNSPYGDKVAAGNKGNVAPRVGFAWDPFKTGKTAVRSGYGISYDSTLVGTFEQNIFANPPFLNSVSIPNTLLDDPASGVPSISVAPKVLHGTQLPANTPYTQQWSFDIQRELGARMVLDVGYYGSKSTHLLGIADINSALPGAAVAAGIVSATTPVTSATLPRLNAVRPYLGYASINVLENWYNSNYNSLQVSAQKRFAGYSSIRLAYTFSKVLTNASSDRSNAPQNVYNRGADYARANFDRPHVFTVSYIYQIPFGNGLTGPAGVLLKGWQLSGITTFNSGLATRVSSSLGLDWAGLGIIAGSSGATPRPDLVANPNANAPHTIAQWFNTAAFAPVPAGQIRPGNAAATSVNGPGLERWDVSLFKNLNLTERFRLQVRGESFNFLNHTNFLGISTGLGTTNFGQVTSAREPRRIQIGMKLSF